MKAISLFASAGIGELSLPKDRFDFVLANELLEQRAKCYKFFYPQTEMLCGDITVASNKEYIILLPLHLETSLNELVNGC